MSLFSPVARFFQRIGALISPPPAWRLPVFFVSGVLLGLVALVFHISEASSYLSDDPSVCVNCHVMAPEYSTWFHSAHRENATCNDCHVPHDNIVRHYAFKAMDGARHATWFTMRWEPQVIRIKPMGQRAVQENCVRCHEDMLHMVGLERVRGDDHGHEDGLRCWDCHRGTPHGRVRGLAATTYEHVPLPGPVTPSWLRRLMQENQDQQEAERRVPQ